MASQPELDAAPRAPLSRERVLRAAITLADESGIAALTMRKLAQVLGVEAMTLYYYVNKKDDLLAGILDLVMGEIELPPDGANWKAALRQTAISSHHVLMRHPWACGLMMSSNRVSPARLQWMEAVLRVLRQGGFSANLTHHAYHALDSHITGFTLWLANIQQSSDDLAVLGATFLQNLPPGEYPYLLEHIEQHVNPSPDDDQSEFEFGLNLILDSLERMRDG